MSEGEQIDESSEHGLHACPCVRSVDAFEARAQALYQRFSFSVRTHPFQERKFCTRYMQRSRQERLASGQRDCPGQSVKELLADLLDCRRENVFCPPRGRASRVRGAIASYHDAPAP